jgi:hypothetical protein
MNETPGMSKTLFMNIVATIFFIVVYLVAELMCSNFLQLGNRSLHRKWIESVHCKFEFELINFTDVSVTCTFKNLYYVWFLRSFYCLMEINLTVSLWHWLPLDFVWRPTKNPTIPTAQVLPSGKKLCKYVLVFNMPYWTVNPSSDTMLYRYVCLKGTFILRVISM